MQDEAQLRVKDCIGFGSWGCATNSANGKSLLRTRFHTVTCRSVADGPTLYGLLRHVSRNTREQYTSMILDAHPGVV